MRLRSLSLLPAVLGAALAQQGTTETVYPADAPVQLGDAIWQACRVVDAITGAPIVGAELSLIEERRTPLPRQTWSKRVGVSDRDGYVRVRSDDLKGGFQMLLLRAKGYGPSAVNGVVPSLIWPLAPGLDVPVELRDWQEQAVAGLRIGLCLGSGNTPDVADATTDAAGRALLRGIDPHNPVADVYPSAPEWALTDYGRLDWVPGDHPVVVNIARGHRVTGRLVDAAGAPKAGIHVGAPQVSRGPWSITQADGSFVLEGAVENPDFTVVVGRQVVRFERPDGEQPFLLKLPELPAAANEPADEGDGPVDENAMPTPRRRPPPPILVEREALPEGPMVAVELRVTDPAGGAIEELEIQVQGPLPRYRHAAEDVRSGVVTMNRLPGKYRITTDSPRFEAELGTIEVVAGSAATLKVIATPLALLPVRVENRESLGSISLRTASDSRDITGEFGDDGTAAIPVPNREPFCFVVGNDLGVHVVRTTLAAAKAQSPFVLKGIAVTKVTGSLVGPDGVAVPADVAILNRHEALEVEGGLDPRRLDLQAADHGAFELGSKHEGLAFVVAVPRDAKLRPAILPVTLPRRGVAVAADLGKLSIAAAPQVVVRRADGVAKTDGMVELVRAGWHDVRRRGPMFVLDEQGGLLAPPLRAGDAVVVPADDWDIDREAAEGEELVLDLPFRTVLQGAGPWSIQLPAGQIAVTLKDKAGAAVAGRIFLADRSIGVPGKLRLQQVPLGVHPVVVVARDRKAVLATVEVKADAVAELVVEMSDR